MAQSPVQQHIQSKNQYWYRVQSNPGTVSGLAESTTPRPDPGTEPSPKTRSWYRTQSWHRAQSKTRFWYRTQSWHNAQSKTRSWHRAQSKTGPWHRVESKTHHSYQRHRVQDVLNPILYGHQSKSQNEQNLVKGLPPEIQSGTVTSGTNTNTCKPTRKAKSQGPGQHVLQRPNSWALLGHRS